MYMYALNVFMFYRGIKVLADQTHICNIKLHQIKGEVPHN